MSSPELCLYGDSECGILQFVWSEYTGYNFEGNGKDRADARNGVSVGRCCEADCYRSSETIKKKAFSLFLRVPDWCEKATLRVNGEPVQGTWKANTYAEVNRIWKKGDCVEWVMDMPVKLLEANPLAEEIRNQVVVKRGPLVYCLESMDIEGGHKIDNVLIPADIRLTPKKIIIEGSPIVALDGTARLVDEVSWKDTLYREVGKADKPVNIRLIPYYAWGNRGKAEMTVWMPLARTNH